MDTQEFQEALSDDLTASTDQFILSRVRELEAIKDGAKLCKQLHIPYLQIDLPKADIAGMLQEAHAVADQFVAHRSSDSDGWKSLCLHGISPTHTASFQSYGYGSDSETPYRWTEVVNRCPITAAWIKTILNAGYFTELHRVRFMWLEPGGYIQFHQDRPDGAHSLGPLNFALNMPDKCYWLFKRWGKVPFKPGAGICVDVSNQHGVWNNSSESRIHIIIHGKYGPAYYDAIARATENKRLQTAGQPLLDTKPRKAKPKISYALWNYMPGTDSPELAKKCKAMTLHFLKLRATQRVRVMQDFSLSRLLEDASLQSEWCVVMTPGNIVHDGFFKSVERILSKASPATMMFAHLLDRKNRGFGIHEQFFIINVKRWKEMGSPRFALAAENEVQLTRPQRSVENVHDDYTPLWLRPTQEEYRLRPRIFGWNIIDRALKRGLEIENVPQDLRRYKCYLYPEENTTALHQAIDQIQDLKLDFPSLLLTDHQKSVLQRLQIEAAFYGQKAFLFNTEGYWEVEARENKRPLDAIFTLASGFKDLVMLREHGATPTGKLVYFDLCAQALAIKKLMYEKWDGRDFPAFIMRIHEENRDELNGLVFTVGHDEFQKKWEEEIKLWGSEDRFQRTFRQAQLMEKEFVHMDILGDPSPITQRLAQSQGKNFAIWYSNCFNFTSSLAFRGWNMDWIEESGVNFLSRLHRVATSQGKDIVIYGEDVAHGVKCPITSDRIVEVFC